MNSIVSAPLLLENEVLRECLRAREEQKLPPCQGLRVAAIVRSAAQPLLQSTALSRCPEQPQDWPAVLRQLHWELSSSTTLRPLANLMGKGALLPDPANLQGGLRSSAEGLPAVLRQHPANRLYTILRVDVVLAGSVQVAAAEVPTQDWVLATGDMLILAADLPVTEQMSPDARIWTAYYYSPDPCCCKVHSPLKAGGAHP